MANADDTRDTPTPANTGETRFTAIDVVEALLAKLEAAKEEPAPPKHARPPTIRARRGVTVTATLYPVPDTNTPWIRLCGHWLEHAGFPLHTRVRVLVVKDCLILIPEPTAAP
jgi:Toxin SymE, type I toxin-antitoxin system